MTIFTINLSIWEYENIPDVFASLMSYGYADLF